MQNKNAEFYIYSFEDWIIAKMAQHKSELMQKMHISHKLFHFFKLKFIKKCKFLQFLATWGPWGEPFRVVGLVGRPL